MGLNVKDPEAHRLAQAIGHDGDTETAGQCREGFRRCQNPGNKDVCRLCDIRTPEGLPIGVAQELA